MKHIILNDRDGVKDDNDNNNNNNNNYYYHLRYYTASSYCFQCLLSKINDDDSPRSVNPRVRVGDMCACARPIRKRENNYFYMCVASVSGRLVRHVRVIIIIITIIVIIINIISLRLSSRNENNM